MDYVSVVTSMSVRVRFTHAESHFVDTRGRVDFGLRVSLQGASDVVLWSLALSDGDFTRSDRSRVFPVWNFAFSDLVAAMLTSDWPYYAFLVTGSIKMITGINSIIFCTTFENSCLLGIS